MMRRLVAVAACLVLAAVGGCSSSTAPAAGATSGAATTRTTSAAASPATQALADGKIPIDCSYVTDAEHLAGLGVASEATSVYTDPASTAMPTTEEQAQQEDRNWPGLGCLYPGADVSLGSVKGWYCPTTNESPGEWVSFVHHGRLVTVNRTSKPNGQSPYKDVLISYASWLAEKL